MNLYNYQILPDKRLIVKYYSGVFSLTDIFHCMQLTSYDLNYDKTFSSLNDLRDSQLVLNRDEVKAFVKTVRESNKVFGKRHIAFLTNSPNQVVFGLLVDHFKQDNIIFSNTFTTLEIALRHLLVNPVHNANVAEVLHNLKLSASSVAQL